MEVEKNRKSLRQERRKRERCSTTRHLVVVIDVDSKCRLAESFISITHSVINAMPLRKKIIENIKSHRSRAQGENECCERTTTAITRHERLLQIWFQFLNFIPHFSFPPLSDAFFAFILRLVLLGRSTNL